MNREPNREVQAWTSWLNQEVIGFTRKLLFFHSKLTGFCQEVTVFYQEVFSYTFLIILDNINIKRSIALGSNPLILCYCCCWILAAFDFQFIVYWKLKFGSEHLVAICPFSLALNGLGGYDIHFRKWSIIWKSDPSPKNFLVKTKKFLQRAGTSWGNQELQAWSSWSNQEVWKWIPYQVPGRWKFSKPGT